MMAACQLEPNIVCDRERLFVALDDVEIDQSSDVDSTREGIQIDIVVNSTLDSGAVGFLSVFDAEGVETVSNRFDSATRQAATRFRRAHLSTCEADFPAP